MTRLSIIRRNFITKSKLLLGKNNSNHTHPLLQ